ncbi:MAG: FAD-dependent oxidoreductase, partial [Phycisphaeraceae bacterium]
MNPQPYDIIVIGGGHAGAEAAWAAANLGARVALVTMNPAKIGAMSCNPAIGGLAKGQMVREIDALGGLMGLAADATGIQFRMLNVSKGPAVQGPRAQCDKYAYAREVQRLLGSRPEIDIIEGTAERIDVRDGRVCGLQIQNPKSEIRNLSASAVVLTTGTFMRGLMHTGERQSEGGRVGEGSAVGISGALRGLGFDLGRLKTGTPPRLAAESIDFDSLQLQPGDEVPVPFSDLTEPRGALGHPRGSIRGLTPRGSDFPALPQRPCWITQTNPAIHDLIRANLHRAPMYNGQIQTTGPRYCPSIEDKVVRFADRDSHHVYLEPESLETNEIYCNGISTSLPADVQEIVVRQMPGCSRARILRHGYAVEYDMVWPHQIDATGMTKKVSGLFLAGQINGTSGYEEAAGQGLLAGLNAVRFVRGQTPVRLRRDQAYLGVMMDDLVTKTPREPYRMFTSR